MSITDINELLLTEYSSQQAIELIRNYDIWGASTIACIPVRKLTLEQQMAVFEYWGLPYHALRGLCCNVSDLESILLPMYSKSSWEVSLTYGEGLTTALRVIGGKLIVERDQIPCVMLKKDLECS